MFSKLKVHSIPRSEGISDRLVVVGLGGRFVDEVLSGLPDVLMPTIRAHLGLSYTQVSLLSLALAYVAAVIEPIGGLLIDIWQRRWLMAWGAAGVGLATAVMGMAPTFTILLLGFVIYGLASGPLAHTADVVLVEAYPEAPERIYTRSVTFDTLGALLAPLLVTVTFWLGLEWRWLLVSLGLASFIYAALILKTHFPPNLNGHEVAEQGVTEFLRTNIRTVLSSRQAMGWLLFLLCHEILEAPFLFTTIWLGEQVGMSQALIGLYKTLELSVSMVSLFYLDRWLARSNQRRILQIAAVGLLFLYPAWLLLPGVWTRFVLAVPLSFLMTVFWPIAKAQSLASVPGKAGTVTAVHSLMGFIPLPLLFGLLAEGIGLTAAMLWVSLGATGSLLLVLLVMPGGSGK